MLGEFNLGRYGGDPSRQACTTATEQWKLFNVQLPNQDAPEPEPSETLPITIVKPCTRDRTTPIFALYDYAHAVALDGEHFTFDHLRVTPNTSAFVASYRNFKVSPQSISAEAGRAV